MHVTSADTQLQAGYSHFSCFYLSGGTLDGSKSANVLPELCDGAGQVGGVCQAVIGEAAFGVPGVITALPRQLLNKKVQSDSSGT